jgi:phosphopantetheine--protein transferase-like protein
MTSIGNDIVDLRCVEEHNPRFPERIMHHKEVAHFVNLGASEAASFLWTAWAAKETAYKALKKADSSLIFSPKLFCYVPEEACVKHPDFEEVVFVTFTKTARYIHCIGKVDPAIKLEQFVAERTPSMLTNPSMEIRTFAASCLSQIYGGQADDYELSKDLMSGAPFAISSLLRETIHLSFSHHGDFLAVVFPSLSK